jgi:hypothetical protein
LFGAVGDHHVTRGHAVFGAIGNAARPGQPMVVGGAAGVEGFDTGQYRQAVAGGE